MQFKRESIGQLPVAGAAEATWTVIIATDEREHWRLFVFCQKMFSSSAFDVDIELSHMGAGSSSFPIQLRTLLPPLSIFKVYIMDVCLRMRFPRDNKDLDG